eukprot:22053-Prorocentrum_lima.AAC.1
MPSTSTSTKESIGCCLDSLPLGRLSCGSLVVPLEPVAEPWMVVLGFDWGGVPYAGVRCQRGSGCGCSVSD